MADKGDTMNLEHRTPKALERILDALDTGIKSPSTGGTTRGGGATDLTGRLDDHGNRRPDPARQDLRDLLKAIATGDEDTIHRVVNRWNPSRKTRDYTSTLTEGEPGCKSCQRLNKYEQVNGHEMCKQCQRLLGRTLAWDETYDGKFPPLRLVDMHHCGVRITDRVMRQILGQQRTLVGS